MGIKIKKRDIDELLRDEGFMTEVMTEATSNWEVQKELAETLGDKLSGQLKAHKEIGQLLRDEERLFETIKRLTIGEGPAEEVKKKDETKQEEIQIVEKKLVRTNQKLKQLNEKLKTTQQQLLRSGKLATVGELASGIIHEINNPLGTIKGLVQLLETEKSSEKSKGKDLKVIESEIIRIQAITEQLRSFARPRKLRNRLVQVNGLINETILLMHHQILKQHIRLTINFDKKLPSIKVDDHQIKQVFVNLIINAFAAMPKGGSLTVTTQLKGAKKKTEGLDQSYVEINFKDTGHGIPQKDLKVIFTPYFTTKKEGTGLGLNISQTIIKKHKGSIIVKSIRHKGTTVTIKLPIKQAVRQLRKGGV